MCYRKILWLVCSKAQHSGFPAFVDYLSEMEDRYLFADDWLLIADRRNPLLTTVDMYKIYNM